MRHAALTRAHDGSAARGSAPRERPRTAPVTRDGAPDASDEREAERARDDAAALLAVLAPGVADAHVSIASGVAFAAATQEVVFGVGHGCAGMDTYSVKVDIPAGVTSVRTLTSDFGPASVEKDAAGNVTSVTWTKPLANLLDADTAYYKLVLRIKAPSQPFTTLFFPAHQTCRGTDGGTTTVDWSATSPQPDGGDEPAPTLVVVPARRSGWNKVTVPRAVTDLAAYFGDAVIVWKGNAAYSANPATADMIGKTAGVTALTALDANDEIWVRY